MAFGDLKVQDLIYEDSSNNEITVVIADLATKANPTFTGTVTVPTATAGDNSTKAASTAFVVASFAPKAAPAFTGNATGVNLTLSGDLTVNGTTTTINTTTLQVEDKNIEIGKVSSPSDTTADGGGWTLLGSTSKTFNWLNATDSWTSSEHIEIASGKNLKVDGTTFFVDGTNNKVGIGTTSLGSYNSSGDNLVIRSSGTTGLTLSGGATDNCNIFFGNAEDTHVSAQINYDNDTNLLRITAGESNGVITFCTVSSNERMRIDSAGRVGIGTQSPVGGDLVVENTTGNAGVALSRVFNGNVSGATNTPSFAFTMSDTATNDQVVASISPQALAGTGDAFKGQIRIFTAAANGTNTERFRIGDTGQLGIGGATYGTSGQVLTSGGSSAAPSWANPAAGGNTVDLVADGAIAAGKPVIIKSNGKAEQVQETIIPANPPVCGDTSGSRLYFSNDIKSKITSDYAANVTGFTATGLTFNCWRENDNHIRGRFTKYTNDNSHDSGFSTTTITSSGNAYGNPLCRYVGDGYWLIVWATGNSSSNPVKCRTIRYNGDLGVENNLMSQGNASGMYFDAVRISDTRTVVTWRQNGNGSIWAHDSSAARVIDWSSSGTSRTFSGGSDAATGIGNHSAGQDPSLAYDSTNSKLVLVCGSAGSSIKIVAGTVSGSSGSGSISWGTVLTFASGSDFGPNATVTYDSTNDKLAVIYMRNSDGKIVGAAITVASDKTVTAYTKAFNAQTQTTDGNSTAVSSRGLFVRAYISNLAARIAGGTISGTTFTWQGSSREMSNSDSASPQINYISAKDRFEVFREKTGVEELYSSQATASVSNNNVTSKNVIGFAPLAISDGNTGTIHLDGNTVDNQSSLTAGTSYWVQNNGTLGTSVATTLAGGIALSSTKLLIKQYAVA